MGNTCCRCCSKRDRSVEDLLDGSLEDKLLGKAEEAVEATTAEDEAWRQRREQLKDEAEMSLGDGDDDVRESRNNEPDMAHASLIWDLSDRNTVKVVHPAAVDLVEEEEDDEEFGSAQEDANDDEDDQETKEHAGSSEDRLTQLSARSDAEDSYASVNDYFRGEDTRVFRDTELDRATDVSDTFLVSTSPSSLRGTVTNSSFMVDDDEVQEQQKEQQQKQEHEGDQADNEDGETEKRRSSSGSSRRRSSKKKSRSRKSMHK